MSPISYSEPSSSPDASDELRNEVDEEYGFVRRCFCGSPVTIATVRGGEHSGRLFYRCVDAEARGRHVQKWWDEAVAEEILGIRYALGEQEERLEAFTSMPNRVDLDLSNVWTQLGLHTEALNRLDQWVDEADRKNMDSGAWMSAVAKQARAAILIKEARQFHVLLALLVSSIALILALVK